MSSSAYPTLEELTRAELVQIADDHDDQAFAHVFRNHSCFRESEGFCEFITGIKNPYANMLFGLNVPEAEKSAREITSRLANDEIPGYWWVGPLTQPSHLGSILTEKGWAGPYPVPAMVVDIDLLPESVGPSGLEIRPVTTSAELEIWLKAVADGYGLPQEVANLLSTPASEEFIPYTAFLDGQAVGTTAVFFHAGIAGIYCVATLPEFRGRGIGAAITAMPLIWARAKGYRIGTLQASSMGYPVYKRLGFQDVCSLSLFTLGVAH